MKGRGYFVLWCGFLVASVCFAAADGSWLKHVPDAERQKVNPFSGQQDAIQAGKKVFLDHCAKCHGEDALGRGKKPSLRSMRVQNATDGELSWLLRNGELGKGMPEWNALPDPTRWQVIAFVKSLGTSLIGAERPEQNSPEVSGATETKSVWGTGR
jgi:mono/diheme cytochrome c family protein